MISTWIGKGSANRNAKWPTKVYSDCNHIPALTAYEYGGFIITPWARPELTNGFTSVGIIYERGELGSIAQIQRIEGKLFETKDEAEEQGKIARPGRGYGPGESEAIGPRLFRPLQEIASSS